MSGIMMLANTDWFNYHMRHSIGKVAIFYGSPHKQTKREPLDPLFCVRPGKMPRSIVGFGRIQAQPILHQDAAWEKYGTSLGAHTEIEWQSQASAVLENSRNRYGGKILAIELIDLRSFPSPVLPETVELTDTGWSDKKEVGSETITRLIDPLPGVSAEQRFEDTTEIEQMRLELNELQSSRQPQTPSVLQNDGQCRRALDDGSVERNKGKPCVAINSRNQIGERQGDPTTLDDKARLSKGDGRQDKLTGGIV